MPMLEIRSYEDAYVIGVAISEYCERMAQLWDKAEPSLTGRFAERNRYRALRDHYLNEIRILTEFDSGPE